MDYELIYGIWLGGLSAIYVADIVTRCNKLQAKIDQIEIKNEGNTPRRNNFKQSVPDIVTPSKKENASLPITDSPTIPVQFIKTQGEKPKLRGGQMKLSAANLREIITSLTHPREKGITMLKIAKRYGIGKPTLYRYIKSSGLVTSHGLALLNSEPIPVGFQDYFNKLSKTDTDNPAKNRKLITKLSTADFKAAVQAVRGRDRIGMSISDIASVYNISSSYLYSHVRANGELTERGKQLLQDDEE